MVEERRRGGLALLKYSSVLVWSWPYQCAGGKGLGEENIVTFLGGVSALELWQAPMPHTHSACAGSAYSPPDWLTFHFRVLLPLLHHQTAHKFPATAFMSANQAGRVCNSAWGSMESRVILLGVLRL